MRILLLFARGLISAPAFAAPGLETTPAERLSKLESAVGGPDGRELVLDARDLLTHQDASMRWADVVDIRRSYLYALSTAGRLLEVIYITRRDAFGTPDNSRGVHAYDISETFTNPSFFVPALEEDRRRGERPGLVAWLAGYFEGKRRWYPGDAPTKGELDAAPEKPRPVTPPSGPARSVQAEQRLAVLGSRSGVHLSGPVVGGGRPPPLEVPYDDVVDLHIMEGGFWHALLWHRGRVQAYAFKELWQDGRIVSPGDPRLELTPAEREAIPEAVASRKARLQQMREKLLPVPSERDIRGPLAGKPGDVATVFHSAPRPAVNSQHRCGSFGAMERLTLAGPAGALQAALDVPASDPIATVLLCHPLPPGGGTMDTHAVFRAMRALRDLGCAVLRFNFRGVGQSAGTWDRGVGELADGRAAFGFLRARYPGLPSIAGGFSFGSWIGTQVGLEGASALLALGPPFASYDFSLFERSGLPKAIVVADRDEFAPLPLVRAAFDRMAEPRALYVVPGATHLLTEDLNAYEGLVRAAGSWLLERLAWDGRRGESFE